MSSRAPILAKLRQALDDGDQTADERAAAAARRIRQQRQEGPTPKIARADGMERIELFVEKAQSVQADVKRITSLADLPDAVADSLRRLNLPLQLRIGDDPILGSLPWDPVEISAGIGRLEEPATMSWAAGALAETGTVAMMSGPRAPSSLNFLGEIHFVVLSAKDIDAGFEGFWRRFRESGADPRTVNFITGPSRTGDIEQKIELGAHGPTALQIFLIDDY